MNSTSLQMNGLNLDPRKKTLIIVSGNIAAGKSTLLEKLRASQLVQQNQERVSIFQEDVAQWNNVPFKDGQTLPFLDIYIQNLQKKDTSVVATFQSYLASLFMQKIFTAPGDIVIVERSLYDNFYIFETTLYRDGQMTELEYYVNKHMLDIQHATIAAHFNVINVQLNTSEEVSYQQMLIRGNQIEIQCYSKEYLHLVADNHKAMIEGLKDKMIVQPLGFDDSFRFISGVVEMTLQQKMHNMKQLDFSQKIDMPSTPYTTNNQNTPIVQ